jgi:hypothetical protein
VQAEINLGLDAAVEIRPDAIRRHRQGDCAVFLGMDVDVAVRAARIDPGADQLARPVVTDLVAVPDAGYQPLSPVLVQIDDKTASASGIVS